MNDYISKPFTKELLRDAILKWISPVVAAEGEEEDGGEGNYRDEQDGFHGIGFGGTDA